MNQLRAIFFLFLLAPVPYASAQSVVGDDSDSFFFTITGGDAASAERVVFSECQKISKYLYRAVLQGEEKKLFGPMVRRYRCSLLENDSESERPTSLQQRVLQTRRFAKSSKEVIAAINQWAADYGWSGQIYNGPGIESVPSLRGMFSLKLGSERGAKIISVEVDVLKRDQDSTDIRMRTFYYGSLAFGEKAEFFSRRTYQSIFNDFAQQLFIEAIEIPPSEMQ